MSAANRGRAVSAHSAARRKCQGVSFGALSFSGMTKQAAGASACRYAVESGRAEKHAKRAEAHSNPALIKQRGSQHKKKQKQKNT